MRGKRQAKTKKAVCWRKVGKTLDRPVQHLNRRLVLGSRQAPEMRLRARHQLPGPELLTRARKRPHPLGGQHMRFDGASDAAGDLVLHGKDVTQLAIVALRPVMDTGDGINELRADAQTLSGAAHASLEHIADAEFTRDLLHVDGTTLVAEARIAADDKQPPYAGETGDQVL